METIKTIFARYSCRGYEHAPFDEEKAIEIIKCGMAAPSAMNKKPYEFVLVDDPTTLEPLNQYHRTLEIAKKASFCILIVGDRQKQPTDAFLQQDCSAVAQNMLLAATDLGLNTLWNGIIPDGDYMKALIKHFNIPDMKVPVCLLIFGRGSVGPTREKEFDEKRIIRGSY